MPVIAMKKGEYRNPDAIYNVIHYMFKSPFIVRGGTGMVFANNLESIVDSFNLVQVHYGKSDRKRIHHIVIGFNETEGISDGMAWDIAIAATAYLQQRVQCCYAVHHGSVEQPKYIHIHLAVNTISWVDGNGFYDQDQNLYDLKSFLNSYTQGMYQWKLG